MTDYAVPVGPIDELFTDLDHRLRGPERVKRRMLDDARAGVVDAAHAYIRGGWDTPTAARRAVEEFGTAEEVAPLFQAELDIARWRHTAGATLLVLPILAFFANLAWDLNPRESAGVSSVAPVFGVTLAAIGTLTILIAAAVVVSSSLLTTPGIWIRRGLRPLGWAGVATLAAGALTLAVSAPAFIAWPPFLAAVVASTVMFGLVTASQRRGRSTRAA